MISVAICDDNIKEAEKVGRLVENCCRERGMVCRRELFYDSRSLFYEVEDGRYYDILLLDIEMPDLNGIVLLILFELLMTRSRVERTQENNRR